MNNDDLHKMARETALGVKELADKLKQLAEPVDIQKLINDGLIEKDGVWYIVHDMEAVPEGFKGLIKEIATSDKGARVKLHKKSQFGRFSKKFEKMGY